MYNKSGCSVVFLFVDKEHKGYYYPLNYLTNCYNIVKIIILLLNYIKLTLGICGIVKIIKSKHQSFKNTREKRKNLFNQYLKSIIYFTLKHY